MTRYLGRSPSVLPVDSRGRRQICRFPSGDLRVKHAARGRGGGAGLMRRLSARAAEADVGVTRRREANPLAAPRIIAIGCRRSATHHPQDAGRRPPGSTSSEGSYPSSHTSSTHSPRSPPDRRSPRGAPGEAATGARPRKPSTSSGTPARTSPAKAELDELGTINAPTSSAPAFASFGLGSMPPGVATAVAPRASRSHSASAAGARRESTEAPRVVPAHVGDREARADRARIAGTNEGARHSPARRTAVGPRR